MGLFGGDSKTTTTQTVQNYDERFGASEGATAVRIGSTVGNVVIGSDDLAALALTTNKDALTLASKLMSETITKAFASSDNRASAAENNLTAAQQSSKEIIQKGQESSDDRLIKIVMAAGALAAFYIWRKK